MPQMGFEQSNLSTREAEDPHLRPRGHWDRQLLRFVLSNEHSGVSVEVGPGTDSLNVTEQLERLFLITSNMLKIQLGYVTATSRFPPAGGTNLHFSHNNIYHRLYQPLLLPNFFI